MRRIRYQVACSLDGYLAGPNGEVDWIVEDQAVNPDLEAMFNQVDTLLMGRLTYEDALKRGSAGFWGKRVIVFSRTLRQDEHSEVTVVSGDPAPVIRELREAPGKDIWLFGGGALAASLLAQDCVDTIEPAIMPVMLGGGVPMLPVPTPRRRLKLTRRREYPSGILWLEYLVLPG